MKSVTSCLCPADLAFWNGFTLSPIKVTTVNFLTVSLDPVAYVEGGLQRRVSSYRFA